MHLYICIYTCVYRAALFTQVRCGAIVAHVKQSRPDSGLGFQVAGFFKMVYSSLDSSHRLCNMSSRTMFDNERGCVR